MTIFCSSPIDSRFAFQQYFHAHWIQGSLPDLTPAIAIGVVTEIELDYEETVRNENETLLTLRYIGIKFLSDMAACAFLNMINENVADARADVETARDLKRTAQTNELVHQAHLDGICFILDALQRYIDGEPLDSTAADAAYGRLGRRTYAAILAMKDYFIERLPGRF